MNTPKKDSPNGIGLAVDAGGGPVIDPSANVLALTEAANSRQDDLRNAFEKYHEREISNIKELVALRSNYETRLSEAESKRIDANRAVDAQSVAVANEKQATAANVLANQVSVSADALRTLVAQTATALAEQNRIQMSQVTDRITALERSQYEGRGKAGIAEPMMAELVVEMKRLREDSHGQSSKSQGEQDTWKYIALGMSMVAMMVAIVSSVAKFGGLV